MQYSDRRGNYMFTAGGEPFWPFDPRPEDISILTIAAHLAKQCRFNGATQRFYSVAQHSVQCADWVEEGFAREALMHDAAEAYISDMMRPLKYSPQFKDVYHEVEQAVEIAISEKFGLRHPWPLPVRLIDELMVSTEIAQLIKTSSGFPADKRLSNEYGAISFKVPTWSPHESEVAFLGKFLKLFPEFCN